MARVKHLRVKGNIELTGISRTFVENSGFLKRFLTRFLCREQDIEDVVQEAYLKAYSSEQERGRIEQPKAFLFSIAKNIAINELNRKSRQITSYVEECQNELVPEITATLESEVEASHTLGMYCEAVASLPEQCRRVYLLRKVHGLTHQEISKRLGISRSTVEGHISTGSQRCRHFIRYYNTKSIKDRESENARSIHQSKW